jgi:hypothetical protein
MSLWIERWSPLKVMADDGSKTYVIKSEVRLPPLGPTPFHILPIFPCYRTPLWVIWEVANSHRKLELLRATLLPPNLMMGTDQPTKLSNDKLDYT